MDVETTTDVGQEPAEPVVPHPPEDEPETDDEETDEDAPEEEVPDPKGVGATAP